jgi:uridine kinase
MAKRNYLVEGLSGAGKSSVYEELVRRGYTAITTDLFHRNQNIAPAAAAERRGG